MSTLPRCYDIAGHSLTSRLCRVPACHGKGIIPLEEAQRIEQTDPRLVFAEQARQNAARGNPGNSARGVEFRQIEIVRKERETPEPKTIEVTIGRVSPAGDRTIKITHEDPS